ncbi:lipopolysaccharide biosynthesis protein [Microbacterium sp. KSW2-29]|uniref:Lipopolysaccharide biosynthesis protein n=1 Tax=Microbacterium phycohabitans TaxID=3075993 RepID=A0ABU3SK41_9MICO|nr:lipopolysaccharide biosynthesis protein [Microbacterium sp. KSW2-29]MDU0344757.1 lipopolysaccharide biosynthesis protein [Microbacterium sp. KSW2-29]
MSSLASAAARGGGITIASQFVKVVLMLGSTIVLARLLNPTDYGLVAMVVAVVGVGEIFRDFGLSMAALQAKSLSQAQQSNLFWINSAVGFTLGVLFFAASYPLAAFYNQPDVAIITQALSVTFVLGGLSTQFKVHINRDLRFVALAIADLLPYALGIGGAIAIAAVYANFWALVAQQLIVAAGTLIFSFALTRWRPGLPRRVPMDGLISFGASFAGTQIISYLTRNIDSLLIGKVWGSTSLGYYDRAYNLVVLPLTQINTPMSRVAVPVLARIAEEQDRFVSYLRRAQLVALYVTSSIFALLFALGTPLVIAVLGEQWAPAGPILSILAVSGIFRSLVQVAYWVYMSQGLATAQLRFYLVAQPLLVGVIACGVPFGPLGVAVAVSLGYALFWIASLAWVRRVTKLHLGVLYVDALRALGLVAVPMAAAAFGVRLLVEGAGGVPLLVVVLGGVAALVWAALAFLFFPRVRADASQLIDFGRRAIGGRRNG